MAIDTWEPARFVIAGEIRQIQLLSPTDINMLHPLKNKTLWLPLALALMLFAACTDTGGTTPDPQPDTDPQPTPSGRTEANYSPDNNLIDPFAEEFFDFYTRQVDFPFNEQAVQAMGIREMTVRQYTDIDNDSLSASSTEAGLELSKRFDFSFDAEGRLSAFKRLAFIVGDPADSAALSFSYFPSGLLESIDVNSPNGDVKVTATYNLDRISSYKDPGGFSTSYGYDDPQELRYETRANKAGSAMVRVFGASGHFTDDRAIDLQIEILQRISDFVDYDIASNLKNVIFIEEEEGKPQFELEMGGLESIRGRVRYEYKEGVIHQRKYREEGENAEVEEKRYHYNEFGDLVKVVFNEQDPGIDGVTAIHEFEYDATGRWTKRIHSKKVGVGSTQIDRVDFVSYK